MAKRALTITKFDGGLNCWSDPRDIQDNEFFQSWNAVFDKAGVLRMAGEGHKYIEDLPHLQTSVSGYMQPGFGLFSYGSDANLANLEGVNDAIYSGTVASSASNSSTVTLAASHGDVNSTILFYEGSGNGKYIIGTRYIEARSSAVVTLNSKITVTATTKYKTFQWTASGGFGVSPWSLPEYYKASTESWSHSFNATSDVGSNIITESSHGYEHFDQVLYKNGGTAVGGLVDGGVYAVYKVDANSFRLYKDKTTLAADILAGETDDCLTLSDGGNETHYWRHWPQTDIDFHQDNFLTFGGSGYNTPVIAAEAMDIDETALTITTGGVNLLGLATDGTGTNGNEALIKLVHLSDSEAANSEIMLIASISGDILTIVRGVDNTTAYAHSDGAELIVVKYSLGNSEDIVSATGVTGIIKNRGKYLGRLTYGKSSTTLPIELLNNTADFSSNWTETGDFALLSTKATYTHSTGAATLTQAHGSRVSAGAVSTLYKFSYQIRGLVTDTDRDDGITSFKILGTQTGTETLAARDVHLPLSSGYHEVYFYSQATSATVSFTISVTSTDSGTFVIRKVSIRPVDNSGLTLIPGKPYLLTVRLSSTHPYMNSVSDTRNGSGSTEINESYSDRLPYILLYNDTVTNGTSTGLYLQASNDSPVWVEGQGHTHNYLENVPEAMNLVNNGDFEDGSISSNDFSDGSGVNGEDKGWTSVHPSSDTVYEIKEGNDVFGTPPPTDDNLYYYETYNGKRTLAMRTGGGWDSVGERTDYIYQDITINSGCYYALSFVYASERDFLFSIENRTDSNWLTDGIITTDNPSKWQGVNESFDPDGSSFFDFFGIDTSERFRWTTPIIANDNTINNEGHKEFSYIYFQAPKKDDGSDITIRIKFSSIGFSNISYLTNVTLYKAYPDLVTMSRQNSQYVSLFRSSIQAYDFNLQIRVPDDYNESSTWTLALDGGMYTNPNLHASAPSSTPFGQTGKKTPQDTFQNFASDNQLITIEDFSLTSEGTDVTNLNAGENIILLSDNTSTSSNIHAYSENQSTWKKNIVEWSGLNSRPVFLKVKGGVRICDSNFDNSNVTNLFSYGSEKIFGGFYKRGWSSDNKIIQTPPKLNAKQSGQAAYIHNKFNARNYIEEYFGDLTFLGDKGTTANTSTNLADDHLRTNWENDRISSRGIVLNYLQPTNKKRGGSAILYNREGREYQQHGIGDLLTDSNDDDYLSSTTATGQKRRNPFHFVIRGEDAISGAADGERAQGMQSYLTYKGHITGDVTQLKVAKIELAMTYDSMFAKQIYSVWEGYQWWNQAHPYFSISAGKSSSLPSGINGDEIKQEIINGDNINGYISMSSEETDSELEADSSQNYRENKTWSQSSWWSTSEVLSDGNKWRRATKNMPSVIDFTSRNITSLDDIILKIDVKHTKGFGGGTWMRMLQLMYSPLAYAFTTSTKISNVAGWYGKADVLASDDFPYNGIWRGPVHKNTNDGYSGVSSVVWNNTTNANDNAKDYDFARWERCVFPYIYVYFYNPNWSAEGNGQVSSQTAESTVDFNFVLEGEIEATGWASVAFKLAVSTVNIFDEESYLEIADDEIGVDSDGDFVISEGAAPEIDCYVGKDVLKNEKIKKLKYYLKDTNSDIWYLQFWIDIKENEIHSTTSNYSRKGSSDAVNLNVHYHLPNKYMANLNEVDSYESETLVPASVAEKGIEELVCRYKSGVIANDRLYVGNVKFGEKIFGDKLIKSPAHKFNILPITNYIDVMPDDGDEITSLAYYKDKILCFKKRKVFIIDVSGEYEFLSDTFNNVGVMQNSQVETTKYGIVWATMNGCYLFDGKSLTNLIENKIPISSDMTSISTHNFWSIDTEQAAPPCISYMEKRDALLVTTSSDFGTHTSALDGFHYHFPTKSWSMIYDRMAGTNLGKGGLISNFILNKNGNILYSHFSANTSDIFKWNDGPSVNNAGSSSSNVLGALYFTTRDFDFGDASLRKKIYRVYVTYKTDDTEDSGVSVKAAVNGTGSFTSTFKTTSKFAGTTTACYGSSTLDETDGKWKMAELKFSSPSEVNNIYSFQLQFSEALGNVPASFEINDLSIIYRYKSVK